MNTPTQTGKTLIVGMADRADFDSNRAEARSESLGLTLLNQLPIAV
jgi:hypothetical protein